LLSKQKRAPERPAQAGQAAVAAPSKAAPRTPLEQADADLLACILARPALLDDLDLELDGPRAADIATVLAWAVDGVAIGRSSPPDLVRYLFSRAAELPAIRALLAQANERAEKMQEPHVVLRGLVQGRRRIGGEQQRRLWREQLQDAMRSGDTARAAELQALLMNRLREDRPRPDRTGPTPPKQRPLPPPAPPPDDRREDSA
jgi:hypothetical protein